MMFKLVVCSSGGGGSRKMLVPCRLLLLQVALRLSYHIATGKNKQVRHKLWTFNILLALVSGVKNVMFKHEQYVE